MKYAAIAAAALMLAGCEVTFGENGAVITQTESLLSELVPLGTVTTGRRGQATPDVAQTAPGTASSPAQTATNVAQPVVSQPAPARVREPISLSGLLGTTALPIGVTRGNVEQFKAAVTDAGCTIATREQAAGVQDQTGFSDDKIRLIIDYLWREGEIERPSGSYTLTTGQCADA